jgi:antitoxin component YwqK of YwqJK toxin-antitoxin module
MPYKIVNTHFAKYYTRKFKIITIENKYNNTILNDYINGKIKYKIGKTYDLDISDNHSYYKYREFALNKKIFNDVNYSYYENGEVHENYYINGDGQKHGEYHLYNNLGVLIGQYNYINSKLEGIYKSYFPNCNLQISCNYKNNKFDGLYTEYNIYGKVIKEKIYTNGDIIEEFPLVYWCFAMYVSKNLKSDFMKLSVDEQQSIYTKWYNSKYDIFDKKISNIFVNLGYNIMNINKISKELELIEFTSFVNNDTTVEPSISSSTRQIICDTNSSQKYGFHILQKYIPKKNNIDTIYFGKNGLGCNADDCITPSHYENEVDLSIPTLFTSENLLKMQKNLEQLLNHCPQLDKIFICAYHFQCDLDLLLDKYKHLKIYKIYNSNCF